MKIFVIILLSLLLLFGCTNNTYQKDTGSVHADNPKIKVGANSITGDVVNNTNVTQKVIVHELSEDNYSGGIVGISGYNIVRK